MHPRFTAGQRFREHQRAKWRVFRAFVVAPSISWSLFFFGFMLVQWNMAEEPSASVGEHWGIPVTLLGMYLVGLTVVVTVTTAISVPVYWALRRLNQLSAGAILSAAALQGTALGYCAFRWSVGLSGDYAGYSDIHPGEPALFLLATASCAILGGFVFCWMTIWRKPKAYGASNGPE